MPASTTPGAAAGDSGGRPRRSAAQSRTPTSAVAAVTADPRIEAYAAAFVQWTAERPSGPAWLAARHREGLDRLVGLGWPTRRWEGWRFTDLGPALATAFRPARTGEAEFAPAALEPINIAGAHTLVFVDGHFAPHLSAVGELPQGVVATSLGGALAAHPGEVEAHLDGLEVLAADPFVALNTAFFADGAHVWVAPGVTVARPIHLVFAHGAHADGASPVAAFPRNVIVVGAGARADVVETYVGATTEPHLTCAATSLAVGSGAVVSFCRVQEEGSQAAHMGALQATQAAGSELTAHSVALGGALSRQDVNVQLAGEGAVCRLDGLYVAAGGQIVDHYTWVEHAAPGGTSRELFKGVLSGEAHGVFSGRILVRPGAQATDARQANRNLLLSAGAQVNSNPQLEIFADDVKCTHGAAVGQLDDDALFYLRSRGIDEAAARAILVDAFAGEVLGGIAVEPVRARLAEAVRARLAGAARAEPTPSRPMVAKG